MIQTKVANNILRSSFIFQQLCHIRCYIIHSFTRPFLYVNLRQVNFSHDYSILPTVFSCRRKDFLRQGNSYRVIFSFYSCCIQFLSNSSCSFLKSIHDPLPSSKTFCDTYFKSKFSSVSLRLDCMGLVPLQPIGNCTIVRSIHVSSPHLSKKKVKRKPISYNPKSKSKLIEVWKNMTVRDLASAMDKTLDEVFEIFLYVEDTENLDGANVPIGDIKVLQKAAKIAGMRVTYRAPEKTPEEKELIKGKDIYRKPPAPAGELQLRPPIVTIMGHVDHGKTTLLDILRQSSVVDSEFGGITQHIGAFEVRLSSGEQVTFLDTPGHAAFSAMRQRGAGVTDLIVLVVAADDGVLPQTLESISIAKQTSTPIVVAINKVDKKEADVERCKRELLNAGLQLEEQGGDIQAVEISALKSINIDALVEALVTQAQVLDLRATRIGLVEGVVLEAQMDSRKGKIATCLVQRGTLTKGALLIARNSWAKVRSLFDYSGTPIDKALPGTPVQVMGWRGDVLPSAGDDIIEVQTEKRLKEALKYRETESKKKKGAEDHDAALVKLQEHLKGYKEQLERKKELGIRRTMHRGRPPLEKQFKDDPTPRVSLVLKGDVDGSIEAILDVLQTYVSEDCRLDILSYSLGDITPGDIDMAKAFGGSIYSFNAPISEKMKAEARVSGITVRQHNVIYRLIDDLRLELSDKLPLTPKEEFVGEALVQQEFLVTEERKKVSVAGCLCTKGSLKKGGHSYRLVREGQVLFEGNILSLRHLKKEVDSIRKDVECGVRLASPDLRFRTGDTVVCFRVNMVKSEVDWHPDGFD